MEIAPGVHSIGQNKAGQIHAYLLDAFPEERRYVGPGPWLNVLREHRG